LRTTTASAVIWGLVSIAASSIAHAGACCLSVGICLDVPESACAILQGQYQGDGSVCVEIECVRFGRCCLPDLSCMLVDADECAAAGGSYGGDSSVCSPSICPVVGACCLADGTCADGLTNQQCAESGGLHHGFLSACEATECAGSCSMDDGTCVEPRSRMECGQVGGHYLGDGSTCRDTVSPSLVQERAVSFGQNDERIIFFEQFDDAGGARILDRVVIEIDAAVHVVVSLTNLSEHPIDSFVDVDEFVSIGIMDLTDDPLVPIDVQDIIACDPVVLPPDTTCDFDSPITYGGTETAESTEPERLGQFIGTGSIEVTIAATGVIEYVGNLYILAIPHHFAEAQVKLTYEFVAPAACCLPEGGCTAVDRRFECDALGGAYQGPGTSCANAACLRACCFPDASCADMTLEDCTTINGHPQPAGTTCATHECECIADLDDDGAIGFTDLVSLLSAWGECPGCPEDLDGDDTVGFTDVIVLLSGWGPCA